MNKKINLLMLVLVSLSVVVAFLQYQQSSIVTESAESQAKEIVPEEATDSIHAPALETEQQLDPSIIEQRPTEEQKPSVRTITITNKITDKMITYQKGFIQYLPDFKVTVNNIELKQGQQQQIDVPNGTLTVSYSYNFANGYKKGTKVVEFSVPEDKNELSITFDWKNEWRIIVQGAEPLKIIS